MFCSSFFDNTTKQEIFLGSSNCVMWKYATSDAFGIRIRQTTYPGYSEYCITITVIHQCII